MTENEKEYVMWCDECEEEFILRLTEEELEDSPRCPKCGILKKEDRWEKIGLLVNSKTGEIRSTTNIIAVDVANMIHKKAVQKEREACCFDICDDCEAGVEVQRDSHGSWWHYPGPSGRNGWSRGCCAQAIRERGYRFIKARGG